VLEVAVQVRLERIVAQVLETERQVVLVHPQASQAHL
jgi:hypothetical protein